MHIHWNGRKFTNNTICMSNKLAVKSPCKLWKCQTHYLPS